jgi:hypothetical protein
LPGVGKAVASAGPKGLDKLYERIAATPETAKHFSSRNAMASARAKQIEHWQALFSGGANQGILVYDFDNGSYNRNRLCGVFGLPEGSADPLCETGYGLDEVALGRGDSGGPGFVFNVLSGKWEIAGVASWGTSGFASNGATCPSSRIGCFGALGGHTAVGREYAYNFISQSVPEPGTWALMVAGLAGICVVARRRNVA